MKVLASIVALICISLCGTAEAQYLNMLAITPMSKFNAADNKLFMATVDKALDEGADGVTIPWSNEKTPASGAVTAQRSYTANGMNCRELRIATAYKTLKNESVHDFCKDSAGKWKLAK